MSAKKTSNRANRSATKAALKATEVPTVTLSAAPVTKIKVFYSAVDGSKMDKTFKSLTAASKFAVLMCGEQVELTKNHAIALDGTGKVSADGTSLESLFPMMSVQLDHAPTVILPGWTHVETSTEESTAPVTPAPVTPAPVTAPELPELPDAIRVALDFKPDSAPVTPVVIPAATISEPEQVKIIRHMIQPGHYTYIYMGLDGTAHTVTTKKVNKTKDVPSHWTMTHAGITTKGDNVAAEYNSRDLLQAIADKERSEFARLALAAKAKVSEPV
jgi:hypothetical protein